MLQNWIVPPSKHHGLQFCHHPHGYEFRPTASGTLFDSMAKQTNPEFVNFEADVFWIAHVGVDPVKLLDQYPTRFPLVHIKELSKGTKTGLYTGSAADETSVSVGAGQLDSPAILRECAKIAHTAKSRPQPPNRRDEL